MRWICVQNTIAVLHVLCSLEYLKSKLDSNSRLPIPQFYESDSVYVMYSGGSINKDKYRLEILTSV